MAHSPLKDHWNLERWGSLPITHLNNVRSMAEWHGAVPEDPSGPLLKLKASMSDAAAYGSACRWRVNNGVQWRSVFVSSKRVEQESNHTVGANKRVPGEIDFAQSSFREPTFEMKSSKPRSEAWRGLWVPAELDSHLSTCRGDKREALSRCSAPSAEEGFAVTGIKNASSTRRVTFPRAEPAVDQKGAAWRTAEAHKSNTSQAN